DPRSHERETVNRSRRPSKRELTTINIQLFHRVRNAGRSRKGMNRRPLSVDLGLLEPLEASQRHMGDKPFSTARWAANDLGRVQRSLGWLDGPAKASCSRISVPGCSP